MKRRITVLFASLALLIGTVGSVGCASDAQTGAGIGAGAGAILGAIIGHNSGRHGGEGAAIGAAAGAGIGYIFGNESDKGKAQQRYYSGGAGQW